MSGLKCNVGVWEVGDGYRNITRKEAGRTLCVLFYSLTYMVEREQWKDFLTAKEHDKIYILEK